MRFVLIVALLLAAPAATANDDEKRFDAPHQYNVWGCDIRNDKLTGEYKLYVRAGYASETDSANKQQQWRWVTWYSQRPSLGKAMKDCEGWLERQQKLWKKRQQQE